MDTNPVQQTSQQPAIQSVQHYSHMVLFGLVMFFIGLGGGYLLFGNKSVKSDTLPEQRMQVAPTKTVSLPTSAIPSSSSDKTIIFSPDNKKIATFYNKGAQRGEGDPIFSDVDVQDKGTNQTTTYHLTGPIIYAKDGPLYWSPVDNRIYFTHGTNGILIYALWSSKVDGTDAKLVAGKTDEGKYTSNLVNSAIYGAEAMDYSPDGKLIVTARQDSASNNQSPLWVMNYDGTNSHAILIEGQFININSIKWGKDGKHINFTVWDGTTGTTYMTDINGSKPTKVSP